MFMIADKWVQPNLNFSTINMFKGLIQLVITGRAVLIGGFPKDMAFKRPREAMIPNDLLVHPLFGRHAETWMWMLTSIQAAGIPLWHSCLRWLGSQNGIEDRCRVDNCRVINGPIRRPWNHFWMWLLNPWIPVSCVSETGCQWCSDKSLQWLVVRPSPRYGIASQIKTSSSITGHRSTWYVTGIIGVRPCCWGSCVIHFSFAV